MESEKQAPNLFTRPQPYDIPFGEYQHNGITYTTRREPFREILLGTSSNYTRINVYDTHGDNTGCFLVECTETNGIEQLTAERSRSFVDTYNQPVHRAHLKTLVLRLVSMGYVWRSDKLKMLSDEDDPTEWEEDEGRNAFHMYHTLRKESQQPNSTFTCEIEDNRYVLRRRIN